MLHFFDTSALQHQYLNTTKSTQVRTAISDPNNDCFISSLTIVEIASAFAKHCRTNKKSLKDYGELDDRFWSDIANRTLVVRNPEKREYFRALHLLKYAGVDRKRRITSADALIAATCLELAMQRAAKVRFFIEDKNLYSVLNTFSSYTSNIDFEFLPTPRENRTKLQKLGQCTADYVKCLRRSIG